MYDYDENYDTETNFETRVYDLIDYYQSQYGYDDDDPVLDHLRGFYFETED